MKTQSITFGKKENYLYENYGFINIDDEEFTEEACDKIRDKIFDDLKLKSNKTQSSDLVHEGSSKTLEQLLEINKYAYTVLETSKVVDGIHGKKGIVDLIFISISSSILITNLTLVFIQLIKNIYIINPFYYIFLIVGSLGWLLTGLFAMKSKE